MFDGRRGNLLKSRGQTMSDCRDVLITPNLSSEFQNYTLISFLKEKYLTIIRTSTLEESKCEAVNRTVCQTVLEEECRTVRQTAQTLNCLSLPEESCMLVNMKNCSIVNERKGRSDQICLTDIEANDSFNMRILHLINKFSYSAPQNWNNNVLYRKKGNVQKLRKDVR